MFPRAAGIAMLNRESVRETADDPGALAPAVVFVVIASLAGAVGSALTPSFGGQRPMGFGQQFLLGLGTGVVMLFVFCGVMHLLAALFGGRGAYLGLVRTYGHANGILGLFGLIPCVGGFIALIWGIVAACVQVAEIYRLEMGKAVAVVLITLCIFLLIACAVAGILVSAGVIGNGFGGGFSG
jgi:hypothetical protein